MDPIRNPEENWQEPGSFESSGEGYSGEAEGAWEKTREGLYSVRDQAIHGLETARERLKENAIDVLHSQKERAVSSLKRLTGVIHSTASRLNSEGDHTLAEYTDALAAQIDKAANYLDEREPTAVLQDLESSVRKQAGLFVCGMFVAGLIVARFVRASSSKSGGARPGSAFQSSLAGSSSGTEPATSSPTVIPPGASSRFGQSGLGPVE